MTEHVRRSAMDLDLQNVPNVHLGTLEMTKAPAQVRMNISACSYHSDHT